jgi:hypothetical protein
MTARKMQRMRALAMAVIGAGAFMLASPRPVMAESGDVCCQVPNGPKCCGGACEATATKCEACNSPWACLLF